MPERSEEHGFTRDPRNAPDLLLRPESGRFRAVALVHCFDSRRTLDTCLANLVAQGLEVWVLDNGSTDGSREIALSFLGRGVLAVEDVPRNGVFEHEALLARKEELARRMDADWFVHVDSDEVLQPPAGFATVLDALRAADDGGFDAVNYFEFVFVPTEEDPDHDHARFLETMRWYYPFAPEPFRRVSAWKRRTGEIGLARTAGHDVRLPGTRVFPRNLVLRHYPILSRAHAIRKYSTRTHPIGQLSRGWHGWRERLDPARVVLPPRASLRFDDGTTPLDDSSPAARHLFIAAEVAPATSPTAGPAAKPPARALLVLGMHRSGTSALTGCLLGLGVPLGGPLLPAVAGDNARGYFEVERVMQLHDKLLSAFGATPLDMSSLPAGWERHPLALETRAALAALLGELFGNRPLWAVKDPRLCVLLPLWLPLLDELGVEPGFVLIHRSPWEVARSLGKRGVPAPAALAAWLAHTESAERLTRGHVRTFARYADLLATPVAELERIGAALGVSWPFPPAGESARIEAFLDPGLRSWRDVPPPPQAGRRAALLFDRLAETLDGACGGPDASARIDEAAEACHDLLADRRWPERGPQSTEDALKLEWLAPEIPSVIRAGARYEIGVSFRNAARTVLPQFALSVSYHWRDATDPEITEVFDGLRTPVTRPVPPGALEDVVAVVEAPPRPGSYLLEIDLVREHITWCSWAGVPGPTVPVTVAPA